MCTFTRGMRKGSKRFRDAMYTVEFCACAKTSVRKRFCVKMRLCVKSLSAQMRRVPFNHKAEIQCVL